MKPRTWPIITLVGLVIPTSVAYNFTHYGGRLGRPGVTTGPAGANDFLCSWDRPDNGTITWYLDRNELPEGTCDAACFAALRALVQPELDKWALWIRIGFAEAPNLAAADVEIRFINIPSGTADTDRLAWTGNVLDKVLIRIDPDMNDFTTPAGQADFAYTILHEWGHALGLGDLYLSNKAFAGEPPAIFETEDFCDHGLPSAPPPGGLPDPRTKADNVMNTYGVTVLDNTTIHGAEWLWGNSGSDAIVTGELAIRVPAERQNRTAAHHGLTQTPMTWTYRGSVAEFTAAPKVTLFFSGIVAARDVGPGIVWVPTIFPNRVEFDAAGPYEGNFKFELDCGLGIERFGDATVSTTSFTAAPAGGGPQLFPFDQVYGADCPAPADFGDAPDDGPACEGAPPCDHWAWYPTVYNSTSAVAGRDAPYHRPIAEPFVDDYYLGGPPSYEPAAYQACCDWISCGIDAPVPFWPADDCPFLLCLNPPCTSGVLVIPYPPCPPLAVHAPFGPYPGNPASGWWIFTDTRALSGGPVRPGFVNVAVDWNLSGRWGDVGLEWPLVDSPVGVFTPEFKFTGLFPVITTYLIPPPPRWRWGINPFWTRFMVSEEALAPVFPLGDWDGSGRLGGYYGGETEDWVVQGDPPEDPNDPNTPWTPPTYCCLAVGDIFITLDPGDIDCLNGQYVPVNSVRPPGSTLREFRYGPYQTDQKILTELMQMELKGFSPQLGPVLVRERTDKLSLGLLTNVQADGGGNLVSAESFFDVFFELELSQLGLTLDSRDQPLRMDGGTITQMPPLGSMYASAPHDRVPLFDADGWQRGWLCRAHYWQTQPSECSHPGDMNCDGVVNFADINPFVLALSGQAAYEAAYPNCNWYNADCNGDGLVNFADINPFVALLNAS